MAISGVASMENSLASMATSMVGGSIQQKIGVAIVKQILDTQEMQVQALLQMMSNGPTPTVAGTGTMVNIGV
jgi:hypothetical protein